MKGLSFKSFAPHLIAVFTFLTITVLFFYPVIFEGKVMTQTDTINGISSGQEITEYRKETGKEALWTNAMFSGMPAYMIDVQWSGDYIRHIHDLASLYLPSPARYTFLAMFCFYLLLLCYKVNPYLAIAGGIAYGLNSFFMVSIEAGHIWKVSAIAYMPLVLAGIQTIFSKKSLLGISVTAIAVALLIRSNHVQIAYYVFIVLLIFWIVHLIYSVREKTIKTFAKITILILIAGLLGICANIGKLWTSYEYGAYTVRGKSELTTANQKNSDGLNRDYAFAWSNGIIESLTFIVPYLYGGASAENVGTASELAESLKKAGVNIKQIRYVTQRAPTYWGGQPFTSGPVYPGIIVVFLFILGIIILKGPLRTWLVIATICGFLLSWGENLGWFNHFIFDNIPLYNKFRAVSMTLVIPLLCMPLLGFVGLARFLKNPDKKVLYKTFIIMGGLFTLVFVSSAFLSFKSINDVNINQEFFVEALKNQRIAMFRSSAIRSILFVVLGGGMVYLHSLKKLRYSIMILGLIAVIFTDLYTVDRKYVNTDKFANRSKIAAYQPDAADHIILRDKTHHRVANLAVSTFNEATTSYSHASIGGYHAAKLRRYQDLIENHLNFETTKAISELREGNRWISTPILNMLNTKYFKLGSKPNTVLTNHNALGNAWFVHKIKSFPNADEAIGALKTEVLSKVAITEKLENKSDLAVGAISLQLYQPNYLKYSSSNSGEGFAVFSEVFYEKGWKAYIDNNEVPIRQVNYLLRGLEIPAGEHTIEFRFRPSSYFIGNKMMQMGSIGNILFFAFTIGIQLYKYIKS